MKVTLELPDELAAGLREFEGQSAAVIAAGLRELRSPAAEQFNGLGQVLEALAELPPPEKVLTMRPSPQLNQRIDELLRKHAQGGLSSDERQEWQRYEAAEHLVRMAKARANARLQFNAEPRQRERAALE